MATGSRQPSPPPPEPGEQQGGRLDALVLAAAFAVPFLVYLRTLAPTVAGGDSGELTAAAYCLGVAHDTGYPLYTLLLHAWQWLPIGSIAYRSNLFSAVTMAAMCAALAWVYRLAGGSRTGALLAALVPALMSITWSEATRTETYGLHALLVAVTMGLFLRWERLRTGRSLVWLALAAGLALSHHRSSLFFVIPILAVAAARHRPWNVKQALGVALALIGPSLLYVYLPIRAAASPPMNWGDIRSWSDFAYHSLGGRGARYLVMRPWQDWVRFFVEGTILVPAAQMSAIGVGLVIVGAITALVKRRDAGLCVLVGAVSLAIWCSSFGWGEVKWFIPVFMAYGLWLAAGVEAAAAGVRCVVTTPRRETMARILQVGALVAFPALLLSSNFGPEDHSRDWELYDRGRILMAELEPNALVALSPDTPLMVGYYFKVVERARPDVDIIAPTMLNEQWVQRQFPDPAMRAPIRAALEGRDFAGPDELAQHVMRLLVEHYAARRPVYYDRPLENLPPHYRTLADQTVYRFTPSPPSLLDDDAPDLGMYTDSVFGQVTYAQVPILALHGSVSATTMGQGVWLLLARPDRPVVSGGEMFSVRYQWRCRKPVEQPLGLQVDFVNADWLLAQDNPTAVPPPEAHLAFGTEHPLLYGVTPLAPTPYKTHYEQVAHYVAARDVPPGRYLMRAAMIARDGRGRLLPVARIELEGARRD